MLLLNMFDINAPEVKGMPKEIESDQVITELQRLTGCVIGVNLEAVDPKFYQQHDEIWQMQVGRAANANNAQRLVEMGARFLVITGNPNNGVTNHAINTCLKEIKAAVGDDLILITGKMHGAGVVEELGKAIISEQDIELFAKNGADIILIPAPGTTPGMSQTRVTALIQCAHQYGTLALTAIGTSQEGADVNTIRQLALMSKMAGADIHHIGDTGYMGMALPENIFAYSVAIRGVRHTYSRMAKSVNR